MHFPMGTILKTTGEAATYSPADASPVACWVKRVGGGRVERFGAVALVVDDLTVHMLRETATPAAGDMITVGGQTYTVEAIEPVENDPQGLLWACRVTWGVSVTWARPGNDGGTLHQIASSDVDYTAVAASLGAGSITVTASAWPDGWIRAGDQMTVDGETYTATADVEPGYSGGYRFADVPITPVLVGALAGGEVVTIEVPSGAPGDQIVRAAVADYRAEEIMGGVLTGDRRLVVRAEDFKGAPGTSDVVTIGAEDWAVVSVEAVYSGADVAVWVVQVRR